MSAVPPPYVRQATFTNFQTADAPTVGIDLEAEFNKLKQVTDADQARLAEIQRDDGRLRNESVHPDALSQGTRALVLVQDHEIKGAWATGLIYDQGDVVISPTGGTYMAASDHVAGATFAVDLAASKWLALDTAPALDTALRAELSNATTGAALIGYTPVSTGVAGTVRSFLDALWSTGVNLGATLIRWIQEDAGAIAQTIQSELRRTIRPEHFGADPTGVALSDTAFAYCAALGKTITLRAGATYLLSTRLLPVSGCHFVCDDGMATIKLKTTGGFNSTDLNDKNGANTCVFRYDIREDIGMRGVRFITDGVAEAAIHPIRVNGSAVSDKPIRFERIEFKGIPVCNAGLLSLNTIQGPYVVRDITAKDCGTALNTWTGTPQITVVEVDNDRVAGIHSEPGYIENVRAYNVLLTGAALASYGQQTDCVNIAGIASGTDRKGPTVIGIYADGVGELLDVYCSHGVFKGLRGKNIHLDAVKLIHGAQHNDIEIDAIESCGRSVVVINGSTQATTETRYNNVKIGTVKGVGAVGSFATTTVVLFGNDAGTVFPRNNTVTVANVLADANLDYIVWDTATDTDNGNVVEVMKVTGTPALRFSNCPPDNVRARYKQAQPCRLNVGTNQTLTSAVATTIDYDVVLSDKDSLADLATNKVRPKYPGWYRVYAQVRISGHNASEDIVMRVQLNGVNVTQKAHEYTSSGLEQCWDVSALVYIGEDQVGTTAADISIQATHTGAGSVTVLNTASMSFFEVWPASF